MKKRLQILTLALFVVTCAGDMAHISALQPGLAPSPMDFTRESAFSQASINNQGCTPSNESDSQTSNVGADTFVLVENSSDNYPDLGASAYNFGYGYLGTVANQYPVGDPLCSPNSYAVGHYGPTRIGSFNGEGLSATSNYQGQINYPFQPPNSLDGRAGFRFLEVDINLDVEAPANSPAQAPVYAFARISNKYRAQLSNGTGKYVISGYIRDSTGMERNFSGPGTAGSNPMPPITTTIDNGTSLVVETSASLRVFPSWLLITEEYSVRSLINCYDRGVGLALGP